MATILAAWAVHWTEYERGWGQRPDGVSYHKSKEDAEQYVKDYDKKYNNEPSVPDLYSKGGTPKLEEVSKEVHDRLFKKGDSVVWK